MSGRIVGRYAASILLVIAWALVNSWVGGASEDRTTLPPGVVKAEDVRVRRSYWLPGRILALVVPEDWTESREPARTDAPRTITFGPPAGRAFRVHVSVIPQSAERSPDVRAIVERSGRALLASAVEDRLVVEELGGAQVSGFFFRLTDRAPKPDEYTYLIQGALRLADLLLTFTVLTNQPDAAEASAALEMLRSAEASAGM